MTPKLVGFSAHVHQGPPVGIMHFPLNAKAEREAHKFLVTSSKPDVTA